MALKEKLKAIKVKGFKGVVAYFTRITDVRDELAAIGETFVEIELVRTTLHGFPKSWEVFVDGIVARENLPGWDRMLSDYVHNEIRRSQNGIGKQEDEGNVALVAKGKKEKLEQGASTSSTKGKGKHKKKEGKEKDMSNVKCWACQKI